jgi:hypothetical protein
VAERVVGTERRSVRLVIPMALVALRR